MKLIGYKRVKGEKGENKWDFYNLYIETEYKTSNAEGGGSQIFTRFAKGKGNSFPSIDSNKFLDLLRNGLKVGSEIDVYFNITGDMVIRILN